METYIIYKYNNDEEKRYVEYIYRTSVSTDSDKGDAIEFDDKELALSVCAYLNRRGGSVYKVAKIHTVVEDVTE